MLCRVHLLMLLRMMELMLFSFPFLSFPFLSCLCEIFAPSLAAKLPSSSQRYKKLLASFFTLCFLWTLFGVVKEIFWTEKERVAGHASHSHLYIYTCTSTYASNLQKVACAGSPPLSNHPLKEKKEGEGFLSGFAMVQMGVGSLLPHS